MVLSFLFRGMARDYSSVATCQVEVPCAGLLPWYAGHVLSTKANETRRRHPLEKAEVSIPVWLLSPLPAYIPCWTTGQDIWHLLRL